MAFNPSNCTDSFGIEDDFQTTLSSSITDSDTAIPLTALPTPIEGTLVIEPDTANEEEIYYTSQGSGVVNVPSASAGRGVYGTAVSHNSGVTVKMIPTRAAWEAVKYGGAIEDGSIATTKIKQEPWSTHTVVHTGYSDDPTVIMKYRRNGNTAFINWRSTAAGTSNANSAYMTLPFQAKTSMVVLQRIVDNGTPAVGLLELTAGSATARLYATVAAGNFTASGSKHPADGSLVYEINS